MSNNIVQFNEEIIKGQIKELIRSSVEETVNELLEAEAEKLTQAARYERSEARQGYRSGHYDRKLTTTSGNVTLHVPRLKGISFETAIIERYRRRESSVEEALIEMYLAGVSVRRVEDITEALWGSKVSASTISELNKKAYVNIEAWRNRPLQGDKYPYVYVDGIYLKRNWGGEYENVAVLVAIAVNKDGYREVLGAAEGMKEDKASWVSFFQWLRGRGLDGVKLIVGDKCLGMLEAVGEVFPEAKYQRCVVHFYRNIFSVVPKSKVKNVAKMLKAIHAQESKKASREKAAAVVAELALPAHRQLSVVFPDQAPGRVSRLRESSPAGSCVQQSADQWFSASCPVPSLQQPPSSLLPAQPFLAPQICWTRFPQTQLSSCAPCWDSGCSPQQWLPAPAFPGVPPERSWP